MKKANKVGRNTKELLAPNENQQKTGENMRWMCCKKLAKSLQSDDKDDNLMTMLHEVPIMNATHLVTMSHRPLLR